MKPINRDEPSCNPISSNCVIWSGRNIPCLKICTGDSVSDVVYKLATEVCQILDMLDVSEYDLSCFDLTACGPKDFTALLQLIIDRICALEDVENPSSSVTKGCPDCTVNMAPCFYYDDLKTGNQVTTSQLSDYVTLIGNKFCDILANQVTEGKTLDNHGVRLSSVETKVVKLETTPPPLPSITPDCVLPKEPTRIDIVLQSLEKQFCELRAATGLPNDLFSGISEQCVGLDSATSLGTHGGTMSSISGWKTPVKNVADSLGNLWLTICDLRSAVVNIQTNCCPSPCNGVSVALQATLPNANQLVLFFTGSIPSGLQECDINGTLFKIADESGHSINVRIPLAANLNNSSGFPISLSSTPLNLADNFLITSDICFKNDTERILCERYLEYTFVNTANCPALTILPSQTTITFVFTHTSGNKTYTISLFDSTGTSLLQSQVFNATNPATINGTFGGLTNGTTYKVRVTITGSNGVITTCPFTVASTLPDSCPAPTNVTVVITIP